MVTMNKVNFYFAERILFFQFYDEEKKELFLINESSLLDKKVYIKKIYVMNVEPTFYDAKKISFYDFIFNKRYQDEYKKIKNVFEEIKNGHKDCYIYSLYGENKAIEIVEKMIKHIDEMIKEVEN